MNPTTPFLLSHAPACLPVCESIVAVVRIRRPQRQYRLHRWEDGLRRRSGRWASTVMDTAAPRFLVRCPSVLRINSAVERIDWPRRCRGWSWRRCRWWCWERRRWHCECGLWQSCSRTTATHCHTAVVFLRLGPRVLNHRRAPEAGLAIERQRRR